MLTKCEGWIFIFKSTAVYQSIESVPARDPIMYVSDPIMYVRDNNTRPPHKPRSCMYKVS